MPGAAVFLILTLITALAYVLYVRELRHEAVAEPEKSAIAAALSDPAMIAVAVQIARTVGFKRLVPLLAIAGVAFGVGNKPPPRQRRSGRLTQAAGQVTQRPLWITRATSVSALTGGSHAAVPRIDFEAGACACALCGSGRKVATDVFFRPAEPEHDGRTGGAGDSGGQPIRFTGTIDLLGHERLRDYDTA